MSDTSEDKNDQPLRSVHTSNVPAILEQLGASLLVSTYQAGRLVLFRPDNGVLNTHFRLFDKPMGLALSGERLAIGTAMQICEFHNIPSVADRILAKKKESQSEASTHPPRRNDSVFIPRIAHWTGDIQVHEMVWNERELWYVNTLFSCICKRSDTFNFEPVWRPPFIDKYIPGDCCHLNGLGLRDGKPRYATALGKTNEPEGWRQNKKDGGILIDCQSNEIITEGLSMPHSPRWYRDRLWVLQSGTGSIGYIDSATGRYESVAEMPGFTRGLSFAGPLAFIGLSQVRESAVFGGIPIAERSLEERACGVWIVNIETGETIGFVKFEDAVQEIFAVELLPNSTYPEIVNEDREILSSSYELPDAVLDEVPESLKS